MNKKEILKDIYSIDKLLNKSIDELENEIESLTHLHYSFSSQISYLGLTTIQNDLIRLVEQINDLKTNTEKYLV